MSKFDRNRIKDGWEKLCTSKQRNKQTDRHYENNGHLAMNQKETIWYPRIASGRELVLALTLGLTVDWEHERRTRSITCGTEQAGLSADTVSVRAITSARRTALWTRPVTGQRVVTWNSIIVIVIITGRIAGTYMWPVITYVAWSVSLSRGLSVYLSQSWALLLLLLLYDLIPLYVFFFSCFLFLSSCSFTCLFLSSFSSFCV